MHKKFIFTTKTTFIPETLHLKDCFYICIEQKIKNMVNHALLTGGSGGLGLPVMKELLMQGWQVTARVHSERGEKRIKEANPGVDRNQLNVVKGNVTHEEGITSIIEKMEHIDALVHLAGGFKSSDRFADNSMEDFQSLLSLNAISAFLLLRRVLPVMKKQKKGSIVMIGAKPALYPMGKNAAYAASKAALINLMQSAAEEGRPQNVRANVIVPAVIDTPENRKWV